MSSSSSQAAGPRFLTALQAVLTGSEAASDAKPGPELQELRAAGQALLAVQTRLEATLEARDEQIELQRSLIASIGCPLLQVRSDTLCVPMIGELDAMRTIDMTRTLLAAAAARRVAIVILDFTGAVIADDTVVDLLRELLLSLRLIGVRGVVCGIQPALAALLADASTLRFVRCHIDLASALAAQPALATGQPA